MLITPDEPVVTVELRVELPAALAREARQLGWLTPQGLAALLSAERRRQTLARLEEVWARRARGEPPLMTAADEQAALDVVRQGEGSAAEPPRARQPGTARGRIRVAPDFDEPLEDFAGHER